MNTPLTDAKQVGSKHYMLNELVVPADFARKLERDRARLLLLAKTVAMFPPYNGTDTQQKIWAMANNAVTELEADK